MYFFSCPTVSPLEKRLRIYPKNYITGSAEINLVSPTCCMARHARRKDKSSFLSLTCLHHARILALTHRSNSLLLHVLLEHLLRRLIYCYCRWNLKTRQQPIREVTGASVKLRHQNGIFRAQSQTAREDICWHYIKIHSPHDSQGDL